MWVAFRIAGQVRGDQGSFLAKVLTSALGLFVVALGHQVFANRNCSFATAAKALAALKAEGQALSIQAEAHIASPFGAVSGELQYSLLSNTSSVAWWGSITVIFLGIVWLPTKKISSAKPQSKSSPWHRDSLSKPYLHPYRGLRSDLWFAAIGLLPSASQGTYPSRAA